jgi:hypothetical protein
VTVNTYLTGAVNYERERGTSIKLRPEPQKDSRGQVLPKPESQLLLVL